MHELSGIRYENNERSYLENRISSFQENDD